MNSIKVYEWCNHPYYLSEYSYYAPLSYLSTACLLCIGSIGSCVSFGSIGSVGSLFSIGSVGSAFSIGCVNGFYRDCTTPTGDSNGPPILLAIGLLHGLLLLAAVRSILVVGNRWCNRSSFHNIRYKTLYGTGYIVLGLLYIATFVTNTRTSFLFDGGNCIYLISVILSTTALPPISIKWDLTLRLIGVVGASMIAVGAVLTDTFYPLGIAFAVLNLLLSVIVWGYILPTYEKYRTVRQVGWKPVVGLSILLSISIIALSITAFVRNREHAIGTVSINDNTVAEYGVGDGHRKIIFNLTDSQLGSWSRLHDDDKYGVHMMVCGDDTTPYSRYMCVDYNASIERKGSPRAVDNLSLELRDGVDEGISELLFNGLQTKFEDYWIVFGSPCDRTHARQIYALELNSIPYVLVDVITVLDGKFTHEGVALVLPAFKKDLYAHVLGMSGKWKCSKNVTDGPWINAFDTLNKQSDIIDYWVPYLNQNSEYQKNNNGFKAVYPKPTNIDSCSERQTTEWNNMQASLRYIANEDTIGNHKDHSKYAETWVAEAILQDTDFPWRSQYYVMYNKLLTPLFLWDFNGCGYRGRPIDESPQILNIYPTFAYDKPLGGWQAICRELPNFITQRKIDFEIAVQDSKSAINRTFTLLSSQSVRAAFDRGVRSKNGYGWLVGDALEVSFGSISDYVIRDDFESERDYIHHRMLDRIIHVNASISNREECKQVNQYRALTLLCMYILFITLISISWLVCIILFIRYLRNSNYSNEWLNISHSQKLIKFESQGDEDY